MIYFRKLKIKKVIDLYIYFNANVFSSNLRSYTNEKPKNTT